MAFRARKAFGTFEKRAPEVIPAERPFGSQVLTRSYDETDPFLRLKTWLPAY